MAGVLGPAALAGRRSCWLPAGPADGDRRAPTAVRSAAGGVTGRAQYPALTGLAVVALLGVVLVLVTGGMVRRLLGGLLVLAGAGRRLCRPRAGPAGPARLAELLGTGWR